MGIPGTPEIWFAEGGVKGKLGIKERKEEKRTKKKTTNGREGEKVQKV